MLDETDCYLKKSRGFGSFPIIDSHPSCCCSCPVLAQLHPPPALCQPRTPVLIHRSPPPMSLCFHPQCLVIAQNWKCLASTLYRYMPCSCSFRNEGEGEGDNESGEIRSGHRFRCRICNWPRWITTLPIIIILVELSNVGLGVITPVTLSWVLCLVFSKDYCSLTLTSPTPASEE